MSAHHEAAMPQRRKAKDVPADEMLVYDMAHQRWKNLPPDQILDEAATLFNLAVFMAKDGVRRLRIRPLFTTRPR